MSLSRFRGMHVTRRQAALSIQILMLLGLLPPVVVFIATQAPLPTVLLTVALLVAECATAVALWRDWAPAYLALVALSIANSVIVPPVAELGLESLLVLLMPPVVALIVGRPLWVVASAIATPTLFLARVGGQGQAISPPLIGIYLMLVGGIVLARMVVDGALHTSGEHARQAEEARARAAEHAQQLAEANRQQERQLDEQRRLLSLVAALEIPAVQMADGVLFVPIVGHLDGRRAEALTVRLLRSAHDQRAALVVLDVAAIPVIDAAVTQALLNTARALRLIGCQVMLSGISPKIARTLTELELPLTGITTVRSPQEALAGRR